MSRPTKSMGGWESRASAALHASLQSAPFEAACIAPVGAHLRSVVCLQIPERRPINLIKMNLKAQRGDTGE